MLFYKLLSKSILLLLDFLLSLEILLSSCTWIILILLCSIWKCWHLYTAYLTLLQLLLFYQIWMNVCIFCCWFVFYVWGELYAFWVVAFVAVLCYLAVCVCIQVLWFDCWDVTDVARNMRVNSRSSWLILALIVRDIAHISSNRVLFGFDIGHISYNNYNK